MSQEPSPTRRRWRAWLSTLAKIAIAVLAVALAARLLAGVRWADVASRLETASWPLVALAALCLLGRFAIWDVRWYLAMRRVERAPSMVIGFFALLASAAVNMVTPTIRLAGGLLRARYTAHGGSRGFGRAYGVVLYDQLAHNAMMTALSWAALIVMAFVLDRPVLAWGALAAFVAIGVALFLWSRRSGDGGGGRLAAALARRAAAASGRLGKLLGQSQEAVEIFGRLLADRRLRWQVVGLGSCFFLLNAFAQWVVFRGFGADVRMAVVIGAVSLGLAAGMLTGVPGGIGATEAAMVASFAALGVERVDAAAGTLLYRGLHYAVVLTVGLPALAALELRTSMGKSAIEQGS